jgi:hypothetical protein
LGYVWFNGGKGRDFNGGRRENKKSESVFGLNGGEGK